MALLDAQRELIDDPYTLHTDADTAPPAAGPLIVSLPVLQAHAEALLARQEALGVWLSSEDHPDALLEVLGGELDALSLIAVDFPKFTDGRGYSIARLLRDRHGWQGPLRATGQVLRDQAFFLARCGFDQLLVEDARDPRDVARGLDDFSTVYQGASDARPPVYHQPPPAGE